MYKAVITTFEDGKNVGSKMLTEDFVMLDVAIETAISTKNGNMSVIEIRVYGENGAVVAWNDPYADTGITVYRNIDDIYNALTKCYYEMFKYDMFNGTMAQLIGMIKSHNFEHLSHLIEAIEFLSDDEINRVLENFSEGIELRYKNGCFLPPIPNEFPENIYIYAEYPSIEKRVRQELSDMCADIPVIFIDYGQFRQLTAYPSALHAIIGIYGYMQSPRNRGDYDSVYDICTHFPNLSQLFGMLKNKLQHLNGYLHFLNDIQRGHYQVKYNSFFVSDDNNKAGYISDIYTDNQKYGYVFVSSSEIAVYGMKRQDLSFLSMQSINNHRTVSRLINVATNIISDALLRDDKELVEALSLQGHTTFDIFSICYKKSRENILSGNKGETT